MRLVIAAVAGLLAFFLIAILLKLVTGSDDVAGWGAAVLGFLGVPFLVLRYWPKSFVGGATPESRYLVKITADHVSVVDPKGVASGVAWDDLEEVAIETNASGPWGMDLWWVLAGRADDARCAFPGGATGEQEVLARVESLPGADMAQVIAAMGCTSEARFVVWRRPADRAERIAGAS